MSSAEKKPKSFVPLECNPAVFNEFLEKLDIHGLEFTDVYGLDPELLAFVPRPVWAILLVFPVSPAYEKYRENADAHYKPDPNPAVWSKQTIRNSCGTMALIHALANGVDKSELGAGAGARLISDLQHLDASERPKYLESDTMLEKIHGDVAAGGVTEPVDADEEVENHYICITTHGNDLVELDGRRKGPIVRAHGVSGPDLLAIPEALDTVKEFIERESGNLQFSMLALVTK